MRRSRRGQPGYFEAGSFVPRLDVPTKLDRAEGDVHAFGNPHVHLNPHNIALVSVQLAKRLAAIDPANAAFYAARQADFSARWTGRCASGKPRRRRCAAWPWSNTTATWSIS